jgi:hypothetical protein
MANKLAALLKPVFGPETILARLRIGPEEARVSVQKTDRRSRSNIKRCGLTLNCLIWFKPDPSVDMWKPSKYRNATPSLDLAMLPQLIALLTDAARVVHADGLLTPAAWEAAGLEPPTDA